MVKTAWGWVREEEWFRQMQRRTAPRPAPADPLPDWLVSAYEAAAAKWAKPHPSQEHVASEMPGMPSEDTLTRRLRELGIADFRAVHKLMDVRRRR